MSEIQDSPISQKNVLSRREAIKFFLALGPALAVASKNVGTAKAFEEPINNGGRSDGKTMTKATTSSFNLEKNPKKKRQADTPEKTSNSYTRTLIEQSFMMGAKWVTSNILQKLKIDHGNKSLSDNELLEYLRDKPLEGLINSSVAAPIIEEALFRLIPSVFLTKKEDKKHRWDIGIPTSLIFALAHNKTVDEFGESKFAKSIPVTQFMGGLFYWYLMRDRGYKYAVLAHSLNNASYFSVGALLFKIFPEAKAKKMYGIGTK